MSTLTQLHIEPPLSLPKMRRLPLVPVLAIAAAALYVAGIAELMVRTERDPQAAMAQGAAPPAAETNTFAERWAPLQQAQPRGTWIDPYNAPTAAVAEPRIYEQDEFNFLDEQAAKSPPAKPPSRSEARALDRQEVCAQHGMHKNWVSKWRWRCQK